MNVIPEVLNHFNVYNDSAKKLIGISGELELPEMEAITDTLEGSGVLGEIEDPVTGQFSSMKMKIPFAGETGYYPVKIVVRGKASTSNMGKVVKGKKMEPEVELEILYIKIQINNKTVLELDKLNFKYVLNGVDMLAKIRSQC